MLMYEETAQPVDNKKASDCTASGQEGLRLHSQWTTRRPQTAQPVDNKKEPQIAEPVDNKKEPQIAEPVDKKKQPETSKEHKTVELEKPYLKKPEGTLGSVSNDDLLLVPR